MNKKDKVNMALRYAELIMKNKRSRGKTSKLTKEEVEETKSILVKLKMSHRDILKRVASGLTEG